jgi:hypothetical protein
VAGCCEHGNEPSGSIKCREFCSVEGQTVLPPALKGCFSVPAFQGSFSKEVPEVT